MEKQILREQSLCLSPLHVHYTVPVVPIGPVPLRMERRKSAFPYDAILNYLEVPNGSITQQHSSKSPPGKGPASDGSV